MIVQIKGIHHSPDLVGNVLIVFPHMHDVRGWQLRVRKKTKYKLSIY